MPSKLEQLAYEQFRPYAPNDAEAWHAAKVYVAAVNEAWEKICWEIGTTDDSVSLINRK